MDIQEQSPPPAESAQIRLAHTGDLPEIYDIWYTTETGDLPDPPARPPIFPDYPHILETGELYVAEQAGRISGFAGAISRGGVTFLTDLFVRPELQSAGLGGRLLGAALDPHADGIRCTVSSTDVRALALYIRAGMRPQWPNFLLRATASGFGALPDSEVEAIVAKDDDPALAQWDAEIGGRPRPEDHAYWIQHEGGVPLWFRRHGQTIGYGYVRLCPVVLGLPGAARLGPIGAHTPEDAAASVAAAVRWAAERAPVLRLDLPGPHLALAPLLGAGFQIAYVETFVSTAATPFFDAQRYVGSGGSLF